MYEQNRVRATSEWFMSGIDLFLQQGRRRRNPDSVAGTTPVPFPDVATVDPVKQKEGACGIDQPAPLAASPMRLPMRSWPRDLDVFGYPQLTWSRRCARLCTQQGLVV